MYPMRVRIFAVSFMMSNPATWPEPLVGESRPHSMRMAVVLPAPFAPRNPKISPCRTATLMWSTAV